MAFKPSNRRTVKVESTELDLRPIMNMMCILIPLLLSCSQFVKSTYIELNLPQLSGGGPSQSSDDKPPVEEKKVGIKLVITEKGMTIAGNSVVLTSEAGSGPTLPKMANGKYDYKGLETKLKDIVKQIGGKGFIDERTIIITAEDVVEYQVIVTAMDMITSAAEKELKDPSSGTVVKQAWFANIGVGKILL